MNAPSTQPFAQPILPVQPQIFRWQEEGAALQAMYERDPRSLSPDNSFMFDWKAVVALIQDFKALNFTFPQAIRFVKETFRLTPECVGLLAKGFGLDESEVASLMNQGSGVLGPSDVYRGRALEA